MEDSDMLRTLILAALLAGAASGQTFEVASVKKNSTGERPAADGKGERLNIYNMPLKFIVAMAWQVPNDRVGGPAWTENDGFDIIGKPAPGVTRDETFAMLQNLLAERFKLTIHHEQKPVPVYALVVAKNGPKLHPASPDSTRRNPCTRDGLQLTCQSQKSSMADLAQSLPRWVSMNWFGMPIVDRTGLSGAYDFSLTWTMTRKVDDTVDPPGLSLFDALQEQLGLRLEQQKAPVDRIVIDHAERQPVEN
jgi:uncharacterized protein (TIGR03435 family)